MEQVALVGASVVASIKHVSAVCVIDDGRCTPTHSSCATSIIGCSVCQIKHTCLVSVTNALAIAVVTVSAIDFPVVGELSRQR